MADYRITTGLPQLPVTGDEKEFRLVNPLYQAMNSLSQALSRAEGAVDFDQSELAQRNQFGSITTQNHRKVYALAETDLDYGRIVNLYLASGKIAARYADATNNTRPAHGIVNSPDGILTGQYGEIMIVEGVTAGISGTVFGSYYYLSTLGQIALTRPAAVGSITQAIGFGLGSAGFYLHISSYFRQN